MTIKELILDYLAAVEDCLDMFEKKFGRRDIMKAAGEGVVSKSGELSDGVEYELHGIGCRVRFPDHEVGFDFASQIDVGFDAWQLWIYAEQFPGRYPDYQERVAVEAALADLVATGEAKPFGGYSNLFRLDTEENAG